MLILVLFGPALCRRTAADMLPIAADTLRVAWDVSPPTQWFDAMPAIRRLPDQVGLGSGDASNGVRRGVDQ